MYVAEAKRLTLAGARKMMATAIARAEEAGIAISVAIVDAGGHVILVERMDGARACAELGIHPAYLPAAEFGPLIAKEDAELSKLMQQIGLKKQS